MFTNGITMQGITTLHGKFPLDALNMASISGEDGELQALDIKSRSMRWDLYEKFPSLVERDLKF